VRGPRADRDGCRRTRAPVEIQRLAARAHGNDLDIVSLQEGCDFAAECAVSANDDALDARAEILIAEVRAVAVHDIAAEARTTDNLGDERPRPRVRDLFGRGPGVGTSHHDRARAEFENERFAGIRRRRLTWGRNETGRKRTRERLP